MRYVVGIALCLLLKQQALLGQDAVTSGQRVRITSARYELDAQIGRVLRATGDTIVIESKGIRTVNYRQMYRTDTLTVLVAAIDRLDVRRRGGTQARRGAVLGFTLGALAGAAIGATTFERCPSNELCLFQPTSSEANAVLGAFGGSVLGMGVGAIVGSLIPGEKWERLPLRTVATRRPLPQHRMGLALGLSF